MASHGPFEAATGDVAGTAVHVQQEGAYVVISMQWGEDKQHAALLTPDLAESMSFALSEEAKNARGFAS